MTPQKMGVLLRVRHPVPCEKIVGVLVAQGASAQQAHKRMLWAVAAGHKHSLAIDSIVFINNGTT